MQYPSLRCLEVVRDGTLWTTRFKVYRPDGSYFYDIHPKFNGSYGSPERLNEAWWAAIEHEEAAYLAHGTETGQAEPEELEEDKAGEAENKPHPISKTMEAAIQADADEYKRINDEETGISPLDRGTA